MADLQQLKSTQNLDDCQRSLDLLGNMPDGDKQLFSMRRTCCDEVHDSTIGADIISFDEKSHLVVSKSMKEHYTTARAQRPSRFSE